MLLKYTIMQGGIGMFLFADVYARNISENDADYIIGELSMSISLQVKKYYQLGVGLLINSILRHTNELSRIPKIHIVLDSVQSNPASYQDELFIGLGIKILNEFCNLDLPLPKYNFDFSKRMFVFGD